MIPKSKLSLLLVPFLFLVFPVASKATNPPPAPTSLPQANPTHDIWDGYDFILKTYVDNKGMVDYQGLKAHREKLDLVADSIGKLDPNVFDSWNPKEKIAFYLNTYNLFTLQTILDHYPIK